MSGMDSFEPDRGEYGKIISEVTPPLDAEATVTLNGDQITERPVPAGDSLRIAHQQQSGSPDRYSQEIPEPPEDPQESVEITDVGTATVTVSGDRVVSITVVPGDRLRIFLERGAE